MDRDDNITKVNCGMSYCANLIDGQCTLRSISILPGEEDGTEFAACDNYKEVGRQYGSQCTNCHTMFTHVDGVVTIPCDCGKNRRHIISR